MHLLDVLAALLLLGATGAFWFGATALAHASDVEAVYFLVIGIVALRSGIQLVRPGQSS